MSFGRNNQKSKSAPLTAEDLTGYYDELNALSGGGLDAYAKGGTKTVDYQGLSDAQIQDTAYQGLSPAQIQALGGLGATRKNEIDVQRERTAEEIAADPSYGVAQKQRARQLSDQDYSARADAIAKETEGAITGMASEEAQRKYQSGRDITAALGQEYGRRYESQLTKEQQQAKDLQLLAQIFFGGKGQVTNSTGRQWNASYYG